MHRFMCFHHSKGLREVDIIYLYADHFSYEGDEDWHLSFGFDRALGAFLQEAFGEPVRFLGEVMGEVMGESFGPGLFYLIADREAKNAIPDHLDYLRGLKAPVFLYPEFRRVV